MPSSQTRWHRVRDAEALARAACERILVTAELAIAARGQFRIVLAGGRTPEMTYRQLAQRHIQGSHPVQWSRWVVYYGDERCLPEQDPERNSMMATKALITLVGIPPAQHHVIPAERGPHAGMARYAEVIEPALPFDLVLLGLGEDGHTASLFPDHAHSADEWVHAVYNAPKPPPERVSLSAKALSATHSLWVLVSGENKRTALHAWQRGTALPITQVQPADGVDVLIDDAAWSQPV